MAMLCLLVVATMLAAQAVPPVSAVCLTMLHTAAALAACTHTHRQRLSTEPLLVSVRLVPRSFHRSRPVSSVANLKKVLSGWEQAELVQALLRMVLLQ